MELHELKKAFDQFSPTQEQREALRRRLLEERQGVRPMKPQKKLKKLTAVLAAAALLLMTCAFAVVSGLDQTLLRYLGVEAEDEPLLSPMAVPLDITVEDSGCTLEVKQALVDRYSALILFTFTAPEGTVLDGDVYSLASYQDMLRTVFPEIADSNYQNCSWGFGWTLLEDGDAADHQISLLYTMDAMSGEPELLGSTLSFSLDQLCEGVPNQREVVLQGEWSCSFTLPEEDSGRTYSVSAPVTVDGQALQCTSVYLSPLSLVVELDRDQVWRDQVFHTLAEDWPNQVFLTTRDGETVPMRDLRAGSAQAEDPDQPETAERGRFSFQLGQIIDPQEITSVTFFGNTILLEP